MANDGGGSSAGGGRSDLRKWLVKATAVVGVATAFLVAIDNLILTGQSLTCRLGVAFPWCETPPQECSLELPLEEYLKCSD